MAMRQIRKWISLGVILGCTMIFFHLCNHPIKKPINEPVKELVHQTDTQKQPKVNLPISFGRDSLYDPGYYVKGILDGTEITEFEEAEPLIGFDAFEKHLEDSLRYPKEALQNKQEGRVMVDMTVDANGRLYFDAVWGFGYGSEQEAVRLIKSAGRWKPFKNLEVNKTMAGSQLIFIDFKLPDSLKN